MPGHEKIGSRVIEFDKTYALCFTGGTRKLPEKDQKEYNKILNLPFPLQVAEKKRMRLWENPEKDPNVVPIKGIKLLEFIKELKFIPIFDHYFQYTHRLFLTDKTAFEYIKVNTQGYFKKE